MWGLCEVVVSHGRHVPSTLAPVTIAGMSTDEAAKGGTARHMGLVLCSVRAAKACHWLWRTCVQSTGSMQRRHAQALNYLHTW